MPLLCAHQRSASVGRGRRQAEAVYLLPCSTAGKVGDQCHVVGVTTGTTQNGAPRDSAYSVSSNTQRRDRNASPYPGREPPIYAPTNAGSDWKQSRRASAASPLSVCPNATRKNSPDTVA